MSLLDTVKQLVLGGHAKWTLTRVDAPRGDKITGQFVAQEFSEEISTTWVSLPIPRRVYPHEQWVRGEAETATFIARLWAEKFTNDVLKDVNKIKATIAPDTKLGRPPIWRFAWGQIEFDCVVTSLGGVRYDELWADGRIKGVSFPLTLRKIGDPLSLSPTDPSKPPHLSRYKPVVEGDTFESLAAGQYGQGMLGVFLRQDSLVAFPRPPAIVRLPDAKHYRRRPLEPKSFALGGDPLAVAARQAALNEREAALEMPFV